MDSVERPRQQNLDRGFGTWKVRSLYRAGRLPENNRNELAKYKLDLEAVQVRWGQVWQ